MAYGNEKFDKRWEIRAVPVTQPSAGADFTVTVPAGVVWRVKSVFARFIASATVGNRFINLAFDDGNNNVFAAVPLNGAAIAASGGGAILSYPNANIVSTTNGALPAVDTVPANGTVFTSAIPDMVLPPGARIMSATSGILAGDQWSSICLLVEQADAN